ncbi:hypothetical protein MUK42_36756 [Musa troglodytarum]|uniref:Uncharacterized protein n=1 Tax=Musa troglodytarum TaxID=320322 RepID=A0A9E7FTN6_9LILI|nr:hypothetical protein MUK42_36756 [Musa troglodytarum]
MRVVLNKCNLIIANYKGNVRLGDTFFTSYGSYLAEEGDKELALCMREEDMGRFAVDMHCSMLHAIRDKLVASVHGLVAAEDADIDQLGHSKESAEVQHRQGKDEHIEALAALQASGGRVAEDEREVECSVVQVAQWKGMAANRPAPAAPQVHGGRMAEDEREVECSVVQSSDGRVAQWKGMAANRPAPAAPQVHGGRMAEDEREVECSVVQSSDGRVAQWKGMAANILAPAAPQGHGGRMAEDEREVECPVVQSSDGRVAQWKGTAANILAPAAPQVYADKLVEDEEVQSQRRLPVTELLDSNMGLLVMNLLQLGPDNVVDHISVLGQSLCAAVRDKALD